jgi:site-specific recombinase XerD
MKPSELEKHDGVVLYRPTQHKTLHKMKSRTIVIGPQGIAILEKYLAYGDKFVFSPRRSVALEMAKRGICRIPPRTVKDAYTNDSYLRAIRRVCEVIFKDDESKWWRPNQLRHSLATEVRAAEKSLESVAAVLGHSNVSTSEIYAERNLGLAIDIMRRLG